MSDEKKKKRKGSEKRVLQSKKQETVNRAFKSKMRRAFRVFHEAVAKGEDHSALLSLAYSLLDKAVKRRICKKGYAARKKSRLSAKIKAI
ncbi:MAG: 30S ribosomal protein S20 [Chlamydiota bacterium]|nr:30S ribosomal protein S20 [Chlamydiota bacterium]